MDQSGNPGRGGKNHVSLWGNTKTMNLSPIIYNNIISCRYFKTDLFQLKTYHEVIDEIYNTVDFLEPNLPNTSQPSSAFCLLYKLFTLKLTEKQIRGLLSHPDSPYIRAVGFLYCRYCTDPKTLWTRFEPYIKDDEEEIKIHWGPKGRALTMNRFMIQLLTEAKYCNTVLPRIPVLVQREINEKLSAAGLLRSGFKNDQASGRSHHNKSRPSREDPRERSRERSRERYPSYSRKRHYYEDEDQYRTDKSRRYDDQHLSYRSRDRYSSPERYPSQAHDSRRGRSEEYRRDRNYER
eukprot:Nk52_evm57s207 gene=Nk52_evmTU57s207